MGAKPMYHFPRWSPDGQRVVVVALSPSSSRLLVIPVAGGDATELRTGAIHAMAADWNASGRITIIGDSAGVPEKSFVVDADGRNLRPFRRDSIASATRDSSVLLFESQRDAGSSIFATDRRRAAARQLTRGFWAEQPSISPDQRQIVFEKRVDPNRMDKSEIVLMALDGTGQTTIAAGTDPSWSPDGKTILFKAMDDTGALWVSVVDVSTRKARRLARGVHPQWSPNGERILYMRDDSNGDTNVYFMSAVGTSPQCLTCQRGAQTEQPAMKSAGAFFALSVADLNASVQWYSEKLGLKVVMRPPKIDKAVAVILEGGGLIVELIHHDDAMPLSAASPAVKSNILVHGIVKAGVIVEDFDSTVATLRSRNVQIAFGPFPAQAHQRANVIVRDNSGNLIQFFGR